MHDSHSPESPQPLRQWTDHLLLEVDSVPAPHIGAGNADELKAKTPFFRAMSIAGAQLAGTVAKSGETFLPGLRGDTDVVEVLLHRARWSCMLFFERAAAGEDPRAGRTTTFAAWGTMLGCSAQEMAGVEGVWMILTGQTPMGSHRLDWLSTLARWLIAPLLEDAPPVTESDLVRMYRRGGEDRRAARRMAEAEAREIRIAEALLGPTLAAEMRRSQLIHPMPVMAVARLIAEATQRGRDLLEQESRAVFYGHPADEAA